MKFVVVLGSTYSIPINQQVLMMKTEFVVMRVCHEQETKFQHISFCLFKYFVFCRYVILIPFIYLLYVQLIKIHGLKIEFSLG